MESFQTERFQNTLQQRDNDKESPVGLDVSVASTSVCALGAVGKIMNEAKEEFGSGIACRAHSRFAWQRDSCVPGGRPLSQWLRKGLKKPALRRC